MYIRLLDARFNDPAYDAYLEAQQRAYSAPGYETLTKYGSTDARTTRDPLSYLAAFDETAGDDGERLVGGIRIHRKIAGQLPSEIHLASQDFNDALADEVAAGESVAEICGIWVDNDWRGRNIASLLCFTSVVAAQRLGATVICGSGPTERIKGYERCGLRFRHDRPLHDRPFPGITAYYSINRAEAIRHREERLAKAAVLLDRALDEGPCIPTDVARAVAETLGLGHSTAPASAGNAR
jgi:ribosomal protein S18 acetylase RimI-like enzyme